jgi:hypothetical protein
MNNWNVGLLAALFLSSPSIRSLPSFDVRFLYPIYVAEVIIVIPLMGRKQHLRVARLYLTVQANFHISYITSNYKM